MGQESEMNLAQKVWHNVAVPRDWNKIDRDQSVATALLATKALLNSTPLACAMEALTHPEHAGSIAAVGVLGLASSIWINIFIRKTINERGNYAG